MVSDSKRHLRDLSTMAEGVDGAVRSHLATVMRWCIMSELGARCELQGGHALSGTGGSLHSTARHCPSPASPAVFSDRWWLTGTRLSA